MTHITLYNRSWQVIMVQNLVICEMEKMQFVTPAEYAASEYHFTIMINAPSNPSAAKRSLNITVTL